MQSNQVVYDYKLIDQIRAKESEYQQALDRARESVKALAYSVMQLRNERLQLEMVEVE